MPNGPKDRYVIDGWKIHSSLAIKTGINWAINKIDYFSKSFAVPKNISVNLFNCIKQFCLMIRTPNIIPTDNGSEYKNSLLDEFCINKNIKYIYSFPIHP